MHRMWIVGLQAAVLAGLAACGGGGGGATTGSGGTGATSPPPGGISYTAGVYPTSSTFANQCATPRVGNCPWGGPCPDTQGSALAEKHFLRSWTNELYLWYSEVADTNPANVGGTAIDYFNTLKTIAVTSTGNPKDRFHFTYDTAQYYALAQSGTSEGFGIVWDVIQGTPPREVRVQEVQAGSGADTAGIRRGDLLLTFDGVDVVNDTTTQGVNTLNAGMFSPADGSAHTYKFSDRDDPNLQPSGSLTAQAVSYDAVPKVTSFAASGGNVGYMLFDDHSAEAESQLAAGIQQLKTAGVTDLVLDMRYNGGGYLDIAAELGYMIAGPTQTAGKWFETLQFNSKNPTNDPVTGAPIAPVPFYTTGQGFSVPSSTSLPYLGLSRVYVLTSGNTCSASESVINGLRGAGITVYQIGGDTCGKPYGFYPKDNCGTTYFSIQFRGVNYANFGDYPDGFSATRTSGDARANLPGCTAADDLTHDLGDSAEGQLAVALGYRANGNTSCPVQVSMVKPSIARLAPNEVDQSLALKKPDQPWRSIRILR